MAVNTDHNQARVDFQNMRIYDRMDIAYLENIPASANWLHAMNQ